VKILGVLKCIIQQKRGLRSDSRGPFFYDYIGALKKVDFFSGLGRFLVNANLQWEKKESYSGSLYQGDSKEKSFK
jgi:hypothetical protein